MPIVFYSQKQQVEEKQSSPSPGKPRLVLEDWLARGLDIKITSFKPLSPLDIALAHSKKYVAGILNGTIPNGFGTFSKEVAQSLLYTTGSMYAAAKHAVKTGETACSLTSGFHHAGFEHAAGYCTFSGLVIAARLLKKQGLVKRVGILDLDEHAGNSTVEITKRLNIGYIKQWSLGYSDVTAETAEDFIARIPNLIKEKFKDCDVLLFQAGADCHVDDPLGGRFTTEQMRRMHKIVFETCKEMKLAAAWNLAGGYQNPIEKVLEIHRNTVIESVRVYENSHNDKMQK